MDSRTFLGIEQGDDPTRWVLPVAPTLCTVGNFLYGGAGLAAALAALEGTTGRETIWASGQFLSYAKPGELLEIEVVTPVSGHQISQARAVARVGDREVLTVNAALGDRPDHPSGQFVEAPDVPTPLNCPLRKHRSASVDAINEKMEVRIAKGRAIADLDGAPSDGQTIMWARVPDLGDRIDASALAIIGDFVPAGVRQALGIRATGKSIDNTLRVVRLVPTDWVLLDIRIHGVDRGFGHGVVHMFAEDGTLIATASQSCILRFWEERRPE
jgi:acyl-CoA thioesterase-2